MSRPSAEQKASHSRGSPSDPVKRMHTWRSMTDMQPACMPRTATPGRTLAGAPCQQWRGPCYAGGSRMLRHCDTCTYAAPHGCSMSITAPYAWLEYTCRPEQGAGLNLPAPPAVSQVVRGHARLKLKLRCSSGVTTTTHPSLPWQSPASSSPHNTIPDETRNASFTACTAPATCRHAKGMRQNDKSQSWVACTAGRRPDTTVPLSVPPPAVSALPHRKRTVTSCRCAACSSREWHARSANPRTPQPWRVCASVSQGHGWSCAMPRRDACMPCSHCADLSQHPPQPTSSCIQILSPPAVTYPGAQHECTGCNSMTMDCSTVLSDNLNTGRPACMQMALRCAAQHTHCAAPAPATQHPGVSSTLRWLGATSQHAVSLHTYRSDADGKCHVKATKKHMTAQNVRPRSQSANQ